ncbi:MAG: hypothetical protein NC485_02315 [Ruminococcus flavefaciens]|nr:hypothetical protein [Ruminococcus flavefaciens]
MEDKSVWYFGLIILSGILFAFLLYPCLMVSERKMSKRYAKADSMIFSPVIFKANGNFHTGRGVLHGSIYICEDRLYIVTFNKNKTGVFFILKKDIVRIECKVNNVCEVLLGVNRELLYIFQTSDADRLSATLKEFGDLK